ncbi:MAG: hypothetical protein ABSF44_12395 [Candidatus Bathyarchaeia archaeon]|jgi:hypothetical protein
MSEEITPWLLQFESGRKWFNTFKSEQTKRLYTERLEHYCKTVGKNPDELIELKIEGLKNINSVKEWQAENLLDSYLYSPSEQFAKNKCGTGNAKKRKKGEILNSPSTSFSLT